MRINGNNPLAWQDFDRETVRNTEGGVHHGESIVQNLRFMGEDTLHAVLPLDRAISMAVGLGKLGGGVGVLGFFAGLFLDIAELIAFPFMFLWNLINIIGHGGAVVVNAANGESDGEVRSEDVREFSWFDTGSVGHNFQDPPSAATAGLTAPTARGVSIARRGTSTSG